MKNISQEMAEHLEEEVTSLTTCWRVVRTDGVVFRYTEHNEDIIFDGDVYKANTPYTRSALASADDFSSTNMEVSGFMQAGGLNEADIKAGLFDHARVEVFAVNWQDPRMGMIRLQSGYFSDLVYQTNGAYKVELRGLMNRLGNRITRSYLPHCDATFGDERCGVDIDSRKVTGTITEVNSETNIRGDFPVQALEENFARGGYIRFTNEGPNRHRNMEIKKSGGTDGFDLELYLPMPYEMQVGDTFELYPGCNKTREACKAYDNIVNFRGFPDLPGYGALKDYRSAPTQFQRTERHGK